MAEKRAYTQKLLRQFDRLTLKLSSQSNMDRVLARLELRKFVEEHGEAVCNTMFEVLKKKDG